MIITKRHVKSFFIAMAILLLGWLALTLWVEQEGSLKSMEIGSAASGRVALVVYDPDPFYNFDQQLCEAFADALADKGWRITISSVSAAKRLADNSFDLYVICANTYNWSPDWATCKLIETKLPLEEKKVVAITLGAGSTGRSQRVFETLIKSRKAILIDSRSFWLWRPNDEALLPRESNIILALNLARDWANEIAETFEKENKH